MKVIIGTFRRWDVGHRYVNYPLSDRNRINKRVTFTVLRQTHIGEYLEQLRKKGADTRKGIPVGANFYEVELEHA